MCFTYQIECRVSQRSRSIYAIKYLQYFLPINLIFMIIFISLLLIIITNLFKKEEQRYPSTICLKLKYVVKTNTVCRTLCLCCVMTCRMPFTTPLWSLGIRPTNWRRLLLKSSSRTRMSHAVLGGKWTQPACRERADYVNAFMFEG